MQALLRPFIWLRRIRHRCGYGVHSPFAFNLITDVIYQRHPYYKYADLEAIESKLPREERYESLKVKRLLFRLVNEMQPRTIIDAGRLSSSANYLQAGHTSARYTGIRQEKEFSSISGRPVDFLYLHDYRHPSFVRAAFGRCVEQSNEQSLFVIEGIRYNREMRQLWQEMQQHPCVGITFDLYDLGLLFFDRKKIKQDYIVNF